MKYFVFLEFTNPEVKELLRSLRDAFTGKKTKKIPHVTVRGPYETPPDKEKLDQLSEKLRGYGVLIGGAGIFEVDKGYVVYLQVQSPMFSEIWWKPDYNVSTFGLNPHITIYETEILQEAKAVQTFLRKERIEIFTFNLELTLYKSSKQLDLFDVQKGTDETVRRMMYGRWKVRPGIVERAITLRESLNQMNNHQ
jgi:hypothetical protein